MRLTLMSALAASTIAGGFALGWSGLAAADPAASNTPPPSAPIFYCPTPSSTAATTPAPTPAKTSTAAGKRAVHHVRYVHARHPGCPTERAVTVAYAGGERHHHHVGRRGEDVHAASFVNDDVSKSQAFIYRYERIHHGLEVLAAREAWRDGAAPEDRGPPPGPLADQDIPPPPPSFDRHPPVVAEDLPPPDDHHGRYAHEARDVQREAIRDAERETADQEAAAGQVAAREAARDAGRDAQDVDAYAREDVQDTHAEGWVDDGHHGPPPQVHIVRRYDAYAAERAHDGQVDIPVDRRDQRADDGARYSDSYGERHFDTYAAERAHDGQVDIPVDRRDHHDDGVRYSDSQGDRHYDAYAAEHAHDGQVEIPVDRHDYGDDAGARYAYGYGDRQIDGHVSAYGFERHDVERDGVDHTSGYAYSDRDGVRHEQHFGDDGQGRWIGDGQHDEGYWNSDHHWIEGRRPPCPPPHDIGCTAGQTADPPRQDGQGPDGDGAYAVSGRDAQGYLVWPGKTPQ